MKKKKYPELRNDTYNKKIKGGKSCVQDNLLTYVCVKYVNGPDDEEKNQNKLQQCFKISL